MSAWRLFDLASRTKVAVQIRVFVARFGPALLRTVSLEACFSVSSYSGTKWGYEK